MKYYKSVVLFLLLPFSLCAQEHWFMAQTDHAEIQSVTATSELVEAQFQGKYLYPPINILDGDFFHHLVRSRCRRSGDRGGCYR